MEAQSSLFPSLLTDTLAPGIAQVFWPLCTPSTGEDAAALKAAVAEHTLQVRLAMQRNEFLDLAAAEALAHGLNALFDQYLDSPPTHQALIVGAARYFVRRDDAEGDLISVLGFDDDTTVFNYVAGAIGRPELKVAP